MKKLIAMLMALMMLLSCTAFAAPTKTGTQTTAQIYINPQLVAGAPEQALTLIETINSLVFTTTEGENYATVAYGANDAQIAEYTLVATDEGGLLMFSSLYPNTAILLDFAKVAALVESVLPNGLDEIAAGAMSAGNEIMNMLSPYAQDLNALLAQMESEVLIDEAGTSMYLVITSQHLGTLLDAWLTRLSADGVLMSLLNAFYAAATESDYSAPSLQEMLASLQSEAAALKTAEAMALGTVGVFNEDGMMTVEITVASTLLISIDMYDYEGMACVDMLAIVASNGTGDWQATYEGIYNGSNDQDVMFGISTASMADYEYAQLYVIQAGQVLAATVEEGVENAGTDDQLITTILSLDMSEGDQSINLGGIAAETVLVEDKGMPSLEDKYVLDVMALPVDMLMNGLPKLAENIVVAMPEVVELVIDALSEVEGFEFLQSITVTEEQMEENTQVSVTTVVTTTTDDEIAPLEAPKMDGMIEDM